MPQGATVLTGERAGWRKRHSLVGVVGVATPGAAYDASASEPDAVSSPLSALSWATSARRAANSAATSSRPASLWSSDDERCLPPIIRMQKTIAPAQPSRGRNDTS